MKRKKVNDERDLGELTELAYEIHDTKDDKNKYGKKKR